MSRTRTARIEVLEKRLAYLEHKRDVHAAEGRPFSYLTDEIRALKWALPILRATTLAGGRPVEAVARVVAPEAFAGNGRDSGTAGDREAALRVGADVVAVLGVLQATELLRAS